MGETNEGHIVRQQENEDAGSKMNVFFDAVREWKNLVDKMAFSTEQKLAVAEKHPGQRYEYNIYQTPDGKIWNIGTIGKLGDAYYGWGCWPRGDQSAAQKDLPEGAVCAKSDFSDEWAWAPVKTDKVFDLLYEQGLEKKKDEISFCKMSLKYDNDSIDFAANLFARRAEIERWAEARAVETASTRQARDIYSMDWIGLMRSLNISEETYAHLLDHTELKLKLARGIDALAGKEVTRIVAY